MPSKTPDFASRLTAWRHANNLSQAGAAKVLKVSKRTLQEWEQRRRRPGLEIVEPILAVIGKTTMYPVTEDDHAAEVREFFRSVNSAQTESQAAASAGLEALARLAKAAAGNTNGQARVITSFLQSCFNSADAFPVRLDEIRHLDWSLQKDLVAVILGCGKAGFADTVIRDAYRQAAGKAGLDDLFSYTEEHNRALARLINQARGDRVLRECLKSIAEGSLCKLSELTYLDREPAKDFALVLDGLIGSARGAVTKEEISDALRKAKL